MKKLINTILGWMFPEKEMTQADDKKLNKDISLKSAPTTCNPDPDRWMRLKDVEPLPNDYKVTPIDDLDDAMNYIKASKEDSPFGQFVRDLNKSVANFKLSDQSKIATRFMLKDNAHEEVMSYSNASRIAPKQDMIIDTMHYARGAYLRFERVEHFRN